MHTDHYAILVGIERYPALGEGNSPLDLRGPRNDVALIKQWLLDPKGGAFQDDSTIFEVHEPQDMPAGTAVPTAAQLDALMARLFETAQANKAAQKGLQVGRRVYIYMSGHGFSPGRQRACLFTADAKEHLGQNVHATGWLSWLQDSGYFREFVLWVDACMNRASFLAPHDPPLPLAASFNPPLANFVAFAAQRPLKAVEAQTPEDGKVHGVFTWTLVEGLRGAAADVNGRVTGRSLADWVRNGMAARFGPSEREDRDVAQEPEIIQEDAGLIFARGLAPPTYAVKLSFPAAAHGQEARLWAGTPPRIAQAFVAGPASELRLKPGLYLLEVPASGLRQGLEVVRSTEVAITEQGPRVEQCQGSEVFPLVVEPRDAAAEIFVVDSRFSLVDRGVGQLSTPLPPGLFKIKVRIGNAVNQNVVLVDGQQAGPSAAAEAVQQLSTVVPLPGTAGTHEYHEAGRHAAVAAANALQLQPGEGVILCMTRTFSRRGGEVQGTRPPWLGVSIVDAAGQAVVDMEQGAFWHDMGDPFAYAVKAVPAGSYFLRQRIDGQAPIEQSLVVCAGWRTEVYVMRRVSPGSTEVDARPRMAVLMRQAGTRLGPTEEAEDRMTEVAKQALAGERKVLTPDLQELLMLKSSNPVAGIIGGHLLLVEHERDSGRDISMLDQVVGRLRDLVGEGHPDVEALALQGANPRTRRIVRLQGAPMFQRSWALLVEGAQRRLDLVPQEMWTRIHALTALPPFLVWNTGEVVKAAARRELAIALYGPARVEAASPVAAMAALPAAAVPIKVRRGTSATAVDMRAVRRRAVKMGIPPSVVESLQAELD
jgi:uncharacterized caspase-like protein